jgi:mRNA interferase MazF
LGVVVQANELLPRSVVLVAPTSRSARAASFRPEIEIDGETTRVLVEQVGAVDARRLGALSGHLSREELWGIDEALMTVLGLR